MKRRDVLKALSLAPLGILPFSKTKDTKKHQYWSVGVRSLTEREQHLVWERYCGSYSYKNEEIQKFLDFLYKNKPLPPLRHGPYSEKYNYSEKYGPKLGEWKYKSHSLWRHVKKDSVGQAITHRIEYENKQGEPCICLELEYGKAKGWRLIWYREGKVLIPQAESMMYLDRDSFTPYRAWGICTLSQTRYDNFYFNGKGEYRYECPIALKDWEPNQDGRCQYESVDRAPNKKVYHVDVGKLPPDKADKFMKKLKEKIKMKKGE